MSVGQAASFLPDYSKAQLSAGHIFTILDLVPKIDVYSTSGKAKPSKSVDVELHNIQFSYPSRPEVTVLKGIDMSIKAGQTVALVGQSGCGKSTSISLLQRYYDLNQGSIVIEGLDLKEYNVRSLRSLISVVSQEPVLFNCSIRENIAYGVGADIAMADIIAAARTANAHDFISEMPQTGQMAATGLHIQDLAKRGIKNSLSL
ncbi:hypothetical protein RRG08_053383 [Elysia crispata]|uniref:ABC transporter domain-containing protein n=1 Tax=Elysia crispata TaxID=231223 RepID=A0AAE0ZI79_9GAST|nr:hypothetical protein RRG08_053383 [Elysia crispata]